MQEKTDKNEDGNAELDKKEETVAEENVELPKKKKLMDVLFSCFKWRRKEKKEAEIKK